MKTAEEILKDHTFISKHGEVKAMDKWVISAMEQYADQFRPKWVKVEDPMTSWPVVTGWYLTKTNESTVRYIARHFVAENFDYNLNMLNTTWFDVVEYMRIVESPPQM